MASYIESIRERPPLRLNIDVETPDGGHYRLGLDDPDPSKVPMGLSFSSVMVGGFERATWTLERDPRLTFPDIQELSTVTILGAGGDTAWQGRIEKFPDTGGFQEQVSPEAVGWQAHLEDDNTAREIFVDRELSKWEPLTSAEKTALLKGTPLVSPVDASVGFSGALQPAWSSSTTYAVGNTAEQNGVAYISIKAGNTNHEPKALGEWWEVMVPSALITALTGAWAGWTRCAARYEHRGIAIGALRVACEVQATNKIGDQTLEGWQISAYAAGGAELAAALAETGNTTHELLGGPSNPSILMQKNGPAGTDGVLYPVFWTTLAVYGAHGLLVYGTLGRGEAQGLLASDAVAYALSKWAPKLAFTTGPEGSIKPSSFVIPQLAFLEPTTVAEMLKQATRFELQDWAVWEGPTFHMHPRGEGGKEWRARVGPAQLQEAGPQVARLWNGCIVAFGDVAGVTRTVGPPGSGAEAASTLLIDEDPENPLNEIGIKKYAKLQMGVTTLAGAEKVGAIFLQETRGLETSGQATIVGHVEDASGVLSPAWAVRAGDTMSFLDAADPSPRRIVHASYEEGTRSTTVQLDQPPDSMVATLERLSVSLIGTGLS